MITSKKKGQSADVGQWSHLRRESYVRIFALAASLRRLRNHCSQLKEIASLTRLHQRKKVNQPTSGSGRIFVGNPTYEYLHVSPHCADCVNISIIVQRSPRWRKTSEKEGQLNDAMQSTRLGCFFWRPNVRTHCTCFMLLLIKTLARQLSV